MGDYAAAGEVLEVAMTSKLSDEDLADEEAVRAKVADLLKLGELKWRYRVVEEGQSPRDEAVHVLEEAQHYINEHIFRILEAEHQSPRHEIDEAKLAKHKEEMWADELSECCQGLALARLIFNGHREEDDTIHDYLQQALRLRESMRHKPKMADTHNSLGALAQRQKSYTKAEAAYRKSLDTRLSISPVTDKERAEKEQACAQSYTSLGNLYLEMDKLEQALESLKQAKDCYVKGFHETHPKVAWALEAEAKVYMKRKDLRAAQRCIDEAIDIRRSAQADGKELFNKELEKNHAARSEITARRSELSTKFQQTRKKAGMVTKMATLKAAGLAQPLLEK